MSIEVRVPTLPESVTDATVLSWHKQPGEAVSRDENLVDLETDKVVLEVPAPTDGVVKEHAVTDGAVVKADELLAVIEAGAQPAAKPAAAEAPKTAAAAPAEAAGGDSDALSPSVRKLLAEHNLDPAKITGTGKDGRLTKADIMTYMDKQPTTPPPATSLPSGARPEERVQMTRLRSRIAQRLKEAQNTAAILTTFNEVDLKAVMDLRNQYKDKFEKDHGIKLGFMSFFVKATIEALKRFPVVNASVDGDDIVYHGYYDIGIAVGSERGLVVPILRDADQLSFAEIEEGIKTFGKKAREGTLTYDELNGGTFTITNGGIFGSMLSTPILNPPQSAILGMHNIVQRPTAVNGQVEIRPIMYIALSYDHRIIDGREAVSSLVTIKQCLEDPQRLLLQV